MSSHLVDETNLTPSEAHHARHALLSRLDIELARLEFTMAGLKSEKMDATRDVSFLEVFLSSHDADHLQAPKHFNTSARRAEYI